MKKEEWTPEQYQAHIRKNGAPSKQKVKARKRKALEVIATEPKAGGGTRLITVILHHGDGCYTESHFHPDAMVCAVEVFKDWFERQKIDNERMDESIRDHAEHRDE